RDRWEDRRSFSWRNFAGLLASRQGWSERSVRGSESKDRRPLTHLHGLVQSSVPPPPTAAPSSCPWEPATGWRAGVLQVVSGSAVPSPSGQLGQSSSHIPGPPVWLP